MNIQNQIIECEEKLLNAMIESNLTVLDELLHENLLFNIPNGVTVTKKMDLDNYRSGNMCIKSILSSDQIIQLIDDTAIVAVNLTLKGKFNQQSLDGHYRYLRVWKLFNTSWKIIAGSCVSL